MASVASRFGTGARAPERARLSSVLARGGGPASACGGAGPAQAPGAMRSVLHRLVGVVMLVVGLLLAREARAEDVRMLEVDGAIGPLTARYLERALAPEATEGVQLVLVRLDTPGGLESSMRQMTRAMLAAPVPVVVG